MKSKNKERFCPICGESLGFPEDRFYFRSDTCGSRECEREMREIERAERDEAHEQLDRDLGW